MVCKLVVKTIDNKFHRYSNVIYYIKNDCLIVDIDKGNAIVFPLRNVIFYSVNS